MSFCVKKGVRNDYHNFCLRWIKKIKISRNSSYIKFKKLRSVFFGFSCFCQKINFDMPTPFLT